jgi:hypothetical protein
MSEKKTLKLSNGDVEIVWDGGASASMKRPFLMLASRTTVFSPGDYRHVSLEKKVSRGEHRTTVHYYLKLEGRAEGFDIGEVKGDAHSSAETLAKFLNLGMIDRSHQDEVGEVVRAAGTLDHSLREQHHQTGRLMIPPTCPTLPRATYRLDLRTLTFTVPARRADWGLIISQAVLPLLVGAGAAYFWPWVGAIWTAVIVAGMIGYSRKFGVPVAVAVSPDQLILQEGGSPAVLLEASAIEQMRAPETSYAPDCLVMSFRTDRGTSSLELRADPETNKWIADAVRYVLSEDPERIDWARLEKWYGCSAAS